VFGRRKGEQQQALGPYPAGHPQDRPGHYERAQPRKRGKRLPGEHAIPSYTPEIAARSIDGHLLRTGTDVFAWYRLGPQR
jgi:hypothetical protein